MNKGFIYFKVTILLFFVILMGSLLPASYNKTFYNEVSVKAYTVVYKDENEENELIKEEVLAVVKDTDLKEQQRIAEEKAKAEAEAKAKAEAEKAIVTKKEEPKTSSENKVKEEAKVENNENKYMGSISISNSSFKKDIMMDDGSYYYLNHNLSGKYDGVGMPIIDFRTNFTGRKTILYAHSAKNGRSPFNYLQNYHNNKSFFNSHRYIYVTYGGKTYKYEIFSVYVSLANDDYDEGLEYFRVMSYSDSKWDERIRWYKSNSEYDTGVNVSGKDKILILQTCSMDDNYYHKYYRANLLVMGKLIEG